MATVDLPGVKAHLNTSGSGSDAELLGVINAALALASNIVGPLSGTASGRCTSDGDVMVLPAMPVQSVETIVSTVDSSALTASDYTLDSAAGLLYDVPAGTYTVGYTAGWVSGQMPEDLALGIKELVRHLWTTQRGGGRPGAPIDPSAGVAYALPNRVLELLAPYMPARTV